MVDVAIIVAAAENGVIGRNNSLPWHLPGDLQYFKRVTMGKPVVMGRKTYESIGRPLPGRSNIVVTRNPDFCAEGVRVAVSLDDALQIAEDIALIDGADELLVIGGAEIYREAIPLAVRLYVTEVHANVTGDAYLPEIDWKVWCEVDRERHIAQGDNPYDFSFVVYRRAGT